MTKSKQAVKYSDQSGWTANIGKGTVGPLEAISPELAFIERFNSYVRKITTRRVSLKGGVPKSSKTSKTLKGRNLSNKVLPHEMQ